jgi:hypothetical protein
MGACALVETKIRLRAHSLDEAREKVAGFAPEN